MQSATKTLCSGSFYHRYHCSFLCGIRCQPLDIASGVQEISCSTCWPVSDRLLDTDRLSETEQLTAVQICKQDISLVNDSDGWQREAAV